MTLQRAITLYIAKNKLSMKEFGALVGVAGQTIYNIESVGQTPSRLTRAKIQLVLGNEYELDDEEDEND